MSLEALFHGDIVSADRVIYTPSSFARGHLLYLQETGILTAKQPHKSARESLSSYLFFIVLSGGGQLEYNGADYQLSAGDCVFISCSRPYYHRSSEDLWTLRWVHFYGSTMGGIYDRYVERGGKPVFRPDDPAEYINLLTGLQHIAASDDQIRDMRIFESLTRLLTMLMEQSTPDSASVRSTAKAQEMQQIKDYLDQHLSEKFSLDDLAARFFKNKFYMARCFREQFGLPINAYLAQKRVTHAKQLLRFSQLSIEQIAAECGISDPNYFARMFKKIEGISPAEYRRMW